MNPRHFLFALVLALASLTANLTSAQERTAPFTAAEREAAYNISIEKRASNILVSLKITDPAATARVRDAILVQYRSLRARDEAMDAMFNSLSGNSPGIETNRAVLLPILSRNLHTQFIERLSADLTPEQVEIVKDKMTYNKVQVTFEAYCEIVPTLSDADKTMILATLKEAREEAIDGGSSDEKSAIFQKYKDKINAYLSSHGHDVAKATKEWEAKQEQADASTAKPKTP